MIYSQSSGLLAHLGEGLGYGYSGRKEGWNSSLHEMVKNVGPIPRGTWDIGMFYDSKEFGPIVCALKPSKSDQNVFGRGGFMIHGDNSKMNKTASHGCIILSRRLRTLIRDSGVKQIVVID